MTVGQEKARWYRWAAALLLLGVAVMYLAYLDDNQVWHNGDSAMYILHAKNIVEGRPYMETGYVFNPRQPWIGPQAYPPGAPLLLAPVYALFGTDLLALKVELALIFVASLGVFLFIIRDELPAAYRLALIPMIAFYPFFWGFRNMILSDIPMLLFLLLSLAAFMRAVASDTESRRRLAWAVAAGLAAFFAIMVRPAAVTLLPSFLAYDLWKDRRLNRESMAAVGVAASLYVLVKLVWSMGSGYTGTIEGYASEFGTSLQMLWSTTLAVVQRLGGMWSNGYSRPLQVAVFGVTGILAVIGYARRVSTRFSVLEPYILFNVGLALLWPWTLHGLRYFIPVLPFLFFYVLVGLLETQRFFKVRSPIPLAVLLVMVLGSYTGRYIHEGLAEEYKWGGVRGEAAREMFAFIEANTDPNEVITLRRPRIVSLFTGRPAMMYLKDGTDIERLEQLREFGVRYALVGPGNHSPRLQATVERNPERFRLLFENDELRLYRLDW